MKKTRKYAFLLLCAVVVMALLARVHWIHAPSDATLIYKMEASGITLEEPLTEEETVAVKRVLWGKIRWPESLYGFPACGFGWSYAVILDGTRYMMSWDRCGTLCIEEVSPGSEPHSYMNISDRERQVLQELFDSRDPQ